MLDVWFESRLPFAKEASMNILIVDDDSDDVYFLRALLAEVGVGSARIVHVEHVEDLNADKTAGISEIDSAVPADYKQRALLDLWRFWI